MPSPELGVVLPGLAGVALRCLCCCRPCAPSISWAAGVPGLELELVACLWDSFALPVLLQPLLDQQRQSMGQAASKPRPGGEPPCSHAVLLGVVSSARPEVWLGSTRLRLLKYCHDQQLCRLGADAKLPPCIGRGRGVKGPCLQSAEALLHCNSIKPLSCRACPQLDLPWLQSASPRFAWCAPCASSSACCT